MTSKRQEIRHALVDALVDGVTLVSGRVHKSRVRSIWESGLPCLLVYSRSDTTEKEVDAPVRLRRTVTLSVECVAKADDDLDDALDALCEQVETVVAANQWLAELDTELMLGDTEVVLTNDGDSMHGRAAVTVTATYWQDFPEDLTGTLDELREVHADTNAGGELPEANELQDVVVLGIGGGAETENAPQDTGPAGGGPVSCAYPLDMAPEESPYGLLTMTEGNTVGTYTTVGNPVQNPLIYVGAPTGGFAGTSARLDFSAGKRVIEHQSITVPAAANVGGGLEAYRISGGEYTAALSNVVTWAVVAYNNGTYRVRVFRGAGLTEVHSSVVGTPPSTIATIYDADAGTFEVRADDVPLALDNDTYTPGQFVSLLFSNEYSASDPTDAGKVLSVKKVTQAADMLGTYVGGETDPCGNAL